MMTHARANGNRRRGRMTREITYQKVLLAVYMLSDGLICRSFNNQIAKECGQSPDAVRRSLAEMERRGVVNAFDSRHGLRCRAIILMDHDDAAVLTDRLKADYSFRSRFGRS
jgi:hypothetical protein